MKKILVLGTIISVLMTPEIYTQEGLPIGWHATDIGSQDIPGSTVYDPASETFTLESTGDQVFGPDNLHFSYTIQTGNFEIVTMVSYVYGMGQMGFYAEPWEEGGVMVREDLSPFSKAYYISSVGGARGGVRYYIRNTGDIDKSLVQGSRSAEVPCWLKLRRIGNNFDAYYSIDGTTWIYCPDATANVPMNSTCYVGLFCRGNANFVQINGWNNPDPQPIVSATAEFEGTKIEQIENIYTVQNPIPSYFVNINNDSSNLIASGVFGHLETDVVNYAVRSSNTEVCLVTTSGSSGSIFFIPKKTGSATVSFSGNVNSYSLMNKFPVFVWEAPAGWSSFDAGNPKVHGFVLKEGTLITMGGAASDSSSILSEGYHFMNRYLPEDSELKIKIDGNQNLSQGGFGGIIFSSDSLDQDAEMARLLYSGNGMIRFEYRNSRGDSLITEAESSASLPLWLKMKKTGNFINSYISDDGVTWNMLGTNLELEFSNGFYGGIATGSNDFTGLTTLRFEDMTLLNSAHTLNNPVPDQRMASGQTRSINIGNVFGHPAGQIPVINVSNSDPLLLTAGMNSDSLLVLTAVDSGRVTIGISTGSGADKIINEFTVDVSFALGADWKFKDVGNITKEGFPARLGDEMFSVTTSGTQIQGSSDNFSFLYQEKSGPQQIIARVGNIEETGSGSQAGIMFRESTLPGSLYILYTMTAYDGIKLKYRWDDNSPSVVEVSDPSIVPPCWLSLKRDGYNYFTASYSIDGVNWTPHGEFSVPLELPQTALAGLVATSGFNEGTSWFDNVEFNVVTGIETPAKTSVFSVKQFPNPFSDYTSISINVSKMTEMEISVFNSAGVKVAQLMHEKVQPGNIVLQFDSGNLTRGVYYYRITTPGQVLTNKMIKIK